MTMPMSEMMPRMATKPMGAPDSNSAAATPMTASGPVATTRKSRWKLCSCSIRIVIMRNSMSGKTAKTLACALALSSTVPPGTTS